MNERGGRHQINQSLLNEFSKRATLTENHKFLANLPIRTYWTTNYDPLVEDALRAAGKTPDVKISVESLATTLHRRDAVVYKMHGDVSLPDKAILTKDDYEAYNSTHQLFSTALQGDLVSKTFLFIGFSFTDPNLSYILSRIRLLLHANRRDHYCLLRRVQRADFPKKADFDYARGKQDLQVKDLKRYGIIGLLVDSYAQYTEVLRQVSRRCLRSRVFLSGSAADYTPWAERDAQALITLLARELTREGFGVVTGLGVGVGPYAVNGSLEQLERERTRVIDDRIIMRAFPLGIASGRAEHNGHGALAAAEAAPSRKRTMSAAARKRIAAAQRERWAAYRKGEAPAAKKTGAVQKAAAKPMRKMSAAARKRISEATKKRWAAYRAKKAA